MTILLIGCPIHFSHESFPVSVLFSVLNDTACPVPLIPPTCLPTRSLLLTRGSAQRACATRVHEAHPRRVWPPTCTRSLAWPSSAQRAQLVRLLACATCFRLVQTPSVPSRLPRVASVPRVLPRNSYDRNNSPLLAIPLKTTSMTSSKHQDFTTRCKSIFP